MRRRAFIALLGGAAAWPLTVRAQGPATPVIGFLGAESEELYEGRLRAFRSGLAEAGFLENQNLMIEYRWAGGASGRLKSLAADLARRPVVTIVAGGEPSLLAAKAATTEIPIVFVGGGNPVQLGFVASLNQPGGNVTGVTVLNVEMAPKRLQVLKELVPSAKRVAVLVNPTSPSLVAQLNDFRSAADVLELKIDFLHAAAEHELEPAVVDAVRRQFEAIVIGPSPLFNLYSERLAALAVRHAVPAIYQTREFAAAGGLASYGGSIPNAYRLAGAYTGRILKGEKPANLPVQQATKIEFFINLKTAKALGLDIPPTLLARADEVIE